MYAALKTKEQRAKERTASQGTWHLSHVRPLLARVTLSTRSSWPFSLFSARSLDDPLLRLPSSILGVVTVYAPVELPLTFLRLFVLCWGLDSTSLILGRFVLSAKSAFPPFFGDSHSMRRYLRPCSFLSSFFSFSLSLSHVFPSGASCLPLPVLSSWC